VRYSEDAAEVIMQITDGDMVSALLGLAVYEMQAAPVSAAAVKPASIEARDARLGTSSDTSLLIPKAERGAITGFSSNAGTKGSAALQPRL
jgi:hypothetical protein